MATTQLKKQNQINFSFQSLNPSTTTSVTRGGGDFSFQDQNIFNQMGNEKKEKQRNTVWFHIKLSLQKNLQNLRQMALRIWQLILEVKGLYVLSLTATCYCNSKL